MDHRPQPNAKSLRVKWAIAAGAPLLLLFSIGLLSYRRLEQEDVAQQWVSHTHQVMEQLDSTLANSLELDAARHDSSAGEDHDIGKADFHLLYTGRRCDWKTNHRAGDGHEIGAFRR